MPKLIEIIGPPGSGKTFIGNKLQRIKKNNKQIFFHTGQRGNFNKISKLNILSQIIIKLKVICTIIIFFILFNKRIFLKKIYKKNFFFRICLIIYRDLVAIEFLKNTSSDNSYILIEPGLIMHFLQDYFYTSSHISQFEINIFNKLFVKSSYIIFTSCSLQLLKKRLKIRERGFPQRMRNLKEKDKNFVIKKSMIVLRNYVLNCKNLNVKKIRTDKSININKLKNYFLKTSN